MDGDTPSNEVRALFDDGDYRAYRAWQTDQVISLAEEIRETVKTANPETQIFHFAALDDTDEDNRLIATGDGILCGYASSNEDASRRAKAAASHGKLIRGGIRAIAPDTVDPLVIGQRIDGWRAAGVHGVDVYNYGLMPETHWQAVGDALQKTHS